MVNKRVVETLQHVGCKLLQFVHREVESFHQLLELHLVDVFANHLMVAGVANDIDTAEVSHWGEDGVRAIEQCHLALVVGLLALGNQHVQAGFLSGEFGAKLFACHILGLLNHPEVEDFGLHHQVVLVANLLLDVGNLLAGEAGNDAVNKRGAYVAIFCKPLLEALVVGTEVVFPQLDIFVNALLQMVSIKEDQLARHDDETLGGVAVAFLFI